MIGSRKAFLLLTSHLGDPQRRPITTAQLRTLGQRVQSMACPQEDRELETADLIALGYDDAMANRILELLSEEDLLSYYLTSGELSGCAAVTRAESAYPLQVRKALGQDAPGCLWARGDLEILHTPMISLVGNRDLQSLNLAFAREVGRQAALQGYTLVSGNARGADSAAQEACLEAGGSVVSVVAGNLREQNERERVLYLSEEEFDAPFTAERALRRNRVIHCLGRIVLVAQCSRFQGGTWGGTRRNLKDGWCPVYCFRDGNAVSEELIRLGAKPVCSEDIKELNRLISPDRSQPVFGKL